MTGLLTINSERTKVPTEAGTFAYHSNVVGRLGRATLTVAILVVFLVTELLTLFVGLTPRLPLSRVVLLGLSRLRGAAALLSALLVFRIPIVCHEKFSMQITDESALQITAAI
jgi:hypothetical protein